MDPKGEEKRSYYINLLIMLLIRFPEVFSINYNIVNDSCRVSFMAAGLLQGEGYKLFKKNLWEAVDAYRDLQGEDSVPVKIRKHNYHQVSLLEIELIVDALLPEIISLVSAFVKESFGDNLLVENEDPFGEEEAINPEDYIDFFLNQYHDRKQENLFAFREAGKVYIYDR